MGLPGDVADLHGERFLPPLDPRADLSRHSIGPCRLYQQPSCNDAARLRDPGEPARFPTLMLARHQAKIGHELPRIVEPPHVSDFSNHGGGNHQGNATKRLQRFHYGTQ